LEQNSTAERLEQRDGVGVARRLGLHETEQGLLIGLFGGQQP